MRGPDIVSDIFEYFAILERNVVIFTDGISPKALSLFAFNGFLILSRDRLCCVSTSCLCMLSDRLLLCSLWKGQYMENWRRTSCFSPHGGKAVGLKLCSYRPRHLSCKCVGSRNLMGTPMRFLLPTHFFYHNDDGNDGQLTWCWSVFSLMYK